MYSKLFFSHLWRSLPSSRRPRRSAGSWRPALASGGSRGCRTRSREGASWKTTLKADDTTSTYISYPDKIFGTLSRNPHGICKSNQNYTYYVLVTVPLRDIKIRNSADNYTLILGWGNITKWKNDTCHLWLLTGWHASVFLTKKKIW